MQVSVQTVGTLGRKLKVAVPAQDVEKEFGERLKRLSQQLKLPGFRPGKVPLKLVETQYGGRLMEEIAGDLIETSLREAIVREGLRPAMGPRIAERSIARDKGLEYTAEFDVFPEIKKLDISGAAIERPVATIAADDIDRTLETICKQRATWNVVERAAQIGDRVKIDFTGRKNGEPVQGAAAKDFFTVLGGNALIADLETGMVGMQAGANQRILATFPADYRHAPLAGQSVEFEISLHEVAQSVLPDVDQALASELGVPEGNVEQLREEIKQNLEREAEQRTRRIMRSQVLDALTAGNDFEVPASMVEAEEVSLRRYSQAAGMRTEEADMRQQARRRVVTGLIVGEVIRTRGIKPKPPQVRAKLEELAATYESPAAFVQWHYEQPRRLAQVESLVAEEQALDELLTQARVEARTMTFQELLQREARTAASG